MNFDAQGAVSCEPRLQHVSINVGWSSLVAQVCLSELQRAARIGDRPPRLPANHADLDLVVAGDVFLEAVLGTCHPHLHLIHGLRMLWVF